MGGLVTAAFTFGAIVTADCAGGVAFLAGDIAHGHDDGVQQCDDAQGTDAVQSSTTGVNGMSSSATSTIKQLATIRIAATA